MLAFDYKRCIGNESIGKSIFCDESGQCKVNIVTTSPSMINQFKQAFSCHCLGAEALLLLRSFNKLTVFEVTRL